MKVQLSISCKNLADLDIFSKSDPKVLIYIKNPITSEFLQVGETETIANNLNPEFIKTFIAEYQFERV